MKSQKEWPMISVMQKFLISYAIIDFAMQMFFQMPYFANISFETLEWYRTIGFRKVWVNESFNSATQEGNHNILSYQEFLDAEWGEKIGLNFEARAFLIQSLNALIIATIML